MFCQIAQPSTYIYLKVENPTFKNDVNDCWPNSITFVFLDMASLKNAYNTIRHVFIKKNLINEVTITICE